MLVLSTVAEYDRPARRFRNILLGAEYVCRIKQIDDNTLVFRNHYVRAWFKFDMPNHEIT